MQAANRVILNTGILYGRMALTIGITLYSTRLVLSELGSTDYGINNLLAGVIAMLSFLNVAMATSTQRFLSFYRGKKDLEMQKKVFSVSLLLHIVVGLLILIFLESLGTYIVEDFLNIPIDRVYAALVIFHFVSVTVFFTILSVPFTATLIGHENMLWLAWTNILETLLKLAIALSLPYLSGDKLIIYGVGIGAITLVSFLSNAIFCLIKYKECSLAIFSNASKSLVKELTSFAGWNLFGAICALARSQGLAVILNLFFGSIINAAFGIANQVGNQLKFFSVSLLRVINPQIMMSEGSNDRQRMLRLSMIASKFGYFLFAFVAIPCMFEMESILGLWLKDVPADTAIFSYLVLLGALINQLTIGLQSALQAIGRIKAYQVVVGSVLILNLPVAYVLLKLGYPPYSALISYCLIELLACSLRAFFLTRYSEFSMRIFFERVILRELFPTAIMCIFCYLMVHLVSIEYRFILTIGGSSIVFAAAVYLTGLCDDEKQIVHQLLSKTLKKIFKKGLLVEFLHLF